MPIKGDMLIL